MTKVWAWTQLSSEAFIFQKITCLQVWTQCWKWHRRDYIKLHNFSSLAGIASHHSFMSDVNLSSYTLLFKPLFDNYGEEEEKFIFLRVSSRLTKERLENITLMHTEVLENRKRTKNPAKILCGGFCGLSHDFKCLCALIAVCPHKKCDQRLCRDCQQEKAK